jgi:hypothetical protein
MLVIMNTVPPQHIHLNTHHNSYHVHEQIHGRSHQQASLILTLLTELLRPVLMAQSINSRLAPQPALTIDASSAANNIQPSTGSLSTATPLCKQRCWPQAGERAGSLNSVGQDRATPTRVPLLLPHPLIILRASTVPRAGWPPTLFMHNHSYWTCFGGTLGYNKGDGDYVLTTSLPCKRPLPNDVV